MSDRPARLESVSACPACGSRLRRSACVARERLYRLSDAAFRYARCGGCGVLYQSRRPVEADIGTFYPSYYGPYQANAATAPAALGRRWALPLRYVGRLNRWLRTARPDPLPAKLHALYEPSGPGRKLLDFGCGSEAFLSHARGRGWDTLGVDFVPDVVAAVRRGGHDALTVSELWDAVPDGSLDFVRLSHVLEHLYDPRATMAALRRKMRPGATLHVATPNAACLTFQLLGPRWFSLDCPRHIVVYSPRSAARMLRRIGFTSVTTFQEVLTKDAARSLGYLLVDLGRLDHDRVMGLQNHRGLAELLYPLVRVAAGVGMADRFHLTARV